MAMDSFEHTKFKITGGRGQGIDRQRKKDMQNRLEKQQKKIQN
jgi:hypothetical protein